ncbi:FISUMP domain-containing protein [Dyadobacter endophyticus]|uniref:FISUMP domain-containing protein n=1 Tax=Dyadobacter endophyticus TaxID=1749036 RepID=UPI003CEB5645
MMKQHVFTVLAILFFTNVGIAQSTGTFTDSRDGQNYKTISFKEDSTGKTITWLAQNLNYKVEGSYAYNDNENNRNEFGLLYTWDAAKKACPGGWHLPTDSEWTVLVDQFGGMDNAGEALKSIKGWSEDGNGTNTSGFNALAGGIRRPDGSYMFQGTLGYFWTSTLINSVDKVWGWNFHYGGPPSSNKQNLKKAFRWDVQVSVGISVRLVQD